MRALLPEVGQDLRVPTGGQQPCNLLFFVEYSKGTSRDVDIMSRHGSGGGKDNKGAPVMVPGYPFEFLLSKI